MWDVKLYSHASDGRKRANVLFHPPSHRFRLRVRIENTLDLIDAINKVKENMHFGNMN